MHQLVLEPSILEMFMVTGRTNKERATQEIDDRFLQIQEQLKKKLKGVYNIHDQNAQPKMNWAKSSKKLNILVQGVEIRNFECKRRFHRVST